MTSAASTLRRETPRVLPSLPIFIVLALAMGFIGSRLMGDAIDTWYTTIDKPPYTPPNWVFGPVWSALYVVIGIAAWLDWRNRDESRAQIALGLFGAQLVLNAAWTGIFFGLEQPAWALVEILVLLATIVAWIAVTWKPTRTAALLLIPYAAWVSYATAITIGVVVLN